MSCLRDLAGGQTSVSTLSAGAGWAWLACGPRSVAAPKYAVQAIGVHARSDNRCPFPSKTNTKNRGHVLDCKKVLATSRWVWGRLNTFWLPFLAATALRGSVSQRRGPATSASRLGRSPASSTVPPLRRSSRPGSRHPSVHVAGRYPRVGPGSAGHGQIGDGHEASDQDRTRIR